MKNTSSIYGFKLLIISLGMILFSCSTEQENALNSSFENSQNLTLSEHSSGFRPSSVSTDINVDVFSTKPISNLIYGVNNDWQQISTNRYSSFADALEGVNYQLIRFPGGWESEYYDWSSNATPGWKNAPEFPGASIEQVKQTNPNAISIVVPTVEAMNLPQWSDEWYAAIQKLKDEADDAINLTGADNISSVEIGNEWWLQWGGGVSRYNKVRKYAHIAKRLAEHIRRSFPKAEFKILVNGDYTKPDEFNAINYVFNASNSLEYIDGLALHTYTGYNSDTHNINDLQTKISECESNLGKNYLSLSEWAPARAYNNNKIYAQGANLLVEQIYEHALAGANEAAFWPPTNNSIPGLGLFNYNLTLQFPTAQLFGDMAKSFRGEVLNVQDGSMRGVAAKNKDGIFIVYVIGKDNPWTTVNLKFNDLKIDKVLSTTLWTPGDGANVSKAIPMKKTDNPPFILEGKRVVFNVNESSSYCIYKIELKLK